MTGPCGSARRRVLAWLIILTLSAIPLQSLASDSKSEFLAHLENRTIHLMERYDVPGVQIALVVDGRLVWSDAFGLADVEAGRTMTVDAVSRAESISKSVTAWGVMTLVEAGAIALDDPVAEHIGSLPPPVGEIAPEITIRHLLSHTSGVGMGTIGREYPPEGPIPALEDALAADLEVVGAPGGAFLYSNTGFNVLELLIERVTGQDFAGYMETEVLGPLGMDDSSFRWSEDLASRMPAGYDLGGGIVAPYVYPEKGSGGLLATVEDVARFVAAGATTGENTVLGVSSLEEMHRPQADVGGLFRLASPAYGLGHFVETLSNGRRAVWHGGQGHGWMTHFHLIPETGDGIVIIANSQRSWPLVAQLLADWSAWNEIDPVGFAIAARAPMLAWILIGVAFIGVLGQSARILAGMRSRSRRFGLSSGGWVAVLQVIAAVALLAIVVLESAQGYSFLDSILPGIATWLRVALVGVAWVLVASALTPETGTKTSPDRPTRIGRSARRPDG